MPYGTTEFAELVGKSNTTRLACTTLMKHVLIHETLYNPIEYS